MKKTLIALCVMSMSFSTFATGSGGPQPPVATVTVTGSGSNVVNSSTAAGSYVLGAGSSVSKASNEQTASAYVGGSGGAQSAPTNQYVSTADCAPATKVSGTLLTGSVASFGGTSATGKSTASNISTGAGTGGAQALGSSYAEVAGKTTLASPNMNLSAEGTAFSGVLTNTGVVGTNGSGSSNGATSSSYTANATGSLFTYKSNGIAGDIKSVTSNVYTRVGGIPQVTSGCGGTNCTTGPSVANNATVEGGATANAGGSVTATIKP